jgi:type III restriction enzyme
MAKYLFNGFSRCLYTEQRFDSDSERRFSTILERDSIKWFKPIKGQFLIFYRHGHEQFEYQPDFVAETENTIFMVEIKMRKELEDPIVLAKKESAIKWCVNATNHSSTYGGKPWKYLLIPHDEIAENITLLGMLERFSK